MAVAGLRLRYGLGRRINRRDLRRIAADRNASAPDKVEALILLGHLSADAGRNGRAVEFYNKAMRSGDPYVRSTTRIFKAMALRQGGVQDSIEALNSVSPRKLTAEDRRLYWLARLDSAILTLDVALMKAEEKLVWERDRTNELVRRSIQFSKLVRAACAKWHGMSRKQRSRRPG